MRIKDRSEIKVMHVLRELNVHLLELILESNKVLLVRFFLNSSSDNLNAKRLEF